MAGIDTDDIYGFIQGRPQYSNDAAWSHLTYIDPTAPRYPGTYGGSMAGTSTAISAQASEYITASSGSRTRTGAPPSVFSNYHPESEVSWAPSTAPSWAPREPTFEQQFAPEPELPPQSNLWCEFHDLKGCYEMFGSDDISAWTQHHERHLNGQLPSHLVCWFCNKGFPAGRSADPRANFARRMRHIARHIHEENSTLHQMRPDFYIVKHMYEHNQLDVEMYRTAMRFTELPKELQLPPDEPEYGSTSSGYGSRLQVYNQEKEDRHRRKHRDSSKKRR